MDFDDGVVSLSGDAKSADALEKAVLMAGNVRGVTNIKADGLTAPPAEAKVEYYTIVSGDTLSKLSKKYYGDAMAYPRIFVLFGRQPFYRDILTGGMPGRIIDRGLAYR